MKQKPITASQRVAELVAEHGSLRKAGAAVGVRFNTLSRIENGINEPRPVILHKLGLSPTPLYERLKTVL